MTKKITKYTEIKKLKKLYIKTRLVKGKKANSIVLLPLSSIYDDSAKLITKTINKICGIEIPIVKCDIGNTGKHLKTTNVIIPGNLATNPFIEFLYLHWMTLLDRWYPGKGGYVLRTIHNPFGTGFNAILLGGSDEDGVKSAVQKFCGLLRTNQKPEIGRLMEIKLGKGHKQEKDRLEAFGFISSYTQSLEDGQEKPGLQKGYKGGSIKNYLLKLGIYGPNADNNHFAKPSQLWT